MFFWFENLIKILYEINLISRQFYNKVNNITQLYNKYHDYIPLQTQL